MASPSPHYLPTWADIPAQGAFGLVSKPGLIKGAKVAETKTG